MTHPKKRVSKPKAKVVVRIQLSQPVGCPGHPLKVTAKGAPLGGTYHWTVSGGSPQLEDAGGIPTRGGRQLYFRSFRADSATGKIPEQQHTLTVTYTHPRGTATASKRVKIHGIDFRVTQTEIARSPILVFESPTHVILWTYDLPVIKTTPNIEIQLGHACPRKDQCAANYQVGWLQTMLSNRREIRYTNYMLDVVGSTPIRDARDNETPTPPPPFYFKVHGFLHDKQSIVVPHEDSPQFPAYPGAELTNPISGQLQSISLSHNFTAWLVVQNIEWASRRLADSFSFLGHFDWSVALSAVTTNTPHGAHFLPDAGTPTAPNNIQPGKGPSSPSLERPTFNTSSTWRRSRIPGVAR
jgi:hypothetical protein